MDNLFRLLIDGEIRYLRTHVFSPLSQKIIPNRAPITVVRKNRMALYFGFLQ